MIFLKFTMKLGIMGGQSVVHISHLILQRIYGMKYGEDEKNIEKNKANKILHEIYF